MGWPEVVQCLVGLDKPQEVLDKMIESAFTPQIFMDTTELYRCHFAVMFGITGWETTLKECIKEVSNRYLTAIDNTFHVCDRICENRPLCHNGICLVRA